MLMVELTHFTATTKRACFQSSLRFYQEKSDPAAGINVWKLPYLLFFNYLTFF
jgi:hypothetical protein